MDSSKIKTLIIVTLALLLALYLGVAAATAQLEVLAWVGGGVFFTICLLLGKHIWILIPATLGMKGSFNFLPGTPAPWHLMTLVVGIFFVIRLAMRRQSLIYRWTWLETLLLLVGLTIGQALVRNPVGFSILGGDVAGGKPYFVFALAFAAYALLMLSDTNLKTWRWAVILYIVFAFLDGLLNVASAIFPALAGATIRIYSNVSVDTVGMVASDISLTEDRISQFADIGNLLGLIASTFWRPLAALDFRRPWQFVIVVIGAGLVMLSGFRSAIALLGINFILGSALRRKWLDIFAYLFIGFLLLMGLIAGGFTRSLPYGVQRSLSFLPIDVAADVATASEGSSEVRFEMWRQALATDRYIQNKILGDGFNISARELKAREDWRFGDARMRQQMTWMEQSMEMGSYHGFHVETIRFTGVVGLIVATLTLIAMAKLASQMISLFCTSPYLGYILFVCLPFLIHPLYYWLVFGSYRADFPVLIATFGMIKLLEKLNDAPTSNFHFS